MLWNLKSLGFLLDTSTTASFKWHKCWKLPREVPTTLAFSAVVTQLVPVNSSITRCRGCHPDSLSKIRAKTRQMEKEAKKLFQSYVVHQGLHLLNLPQLCSKPLKWFPMGNITDPPTAVMLQELYRTMAHMRVALQNISKQQLVLNAPDAVLHSELERTQWAVRGLLSNIGCALCLQGASATSGATPERPATTNAFQQKIEGCEVLWNYRRFLEALVQGSVRREPQAGRDKRKRRKGMKRKQASRF